MAADGRIAASEWILVQRYFQDKADYHISPLTVGEILDRIASDVPGKYFQAAQRQVKMLYPHGKRKSFFDFAPYFVMQAVFGVKISRSRLLENDFGFTLEVILWAQSKRDLDVGVALPFLKTDRIRINLEKFTYEHRSIQNGYLGYMSRFKGKKKFPFPLDQWIGNALSLYGMDTEENREKLSNALNSTYECERWLHDSARNPNYNVGRRNISDQIDLQQLSYLADPAVVFVTNDSDFRTRLTNSLQAERIKTFTELLDVIRTGQSLLPADGSL